LYGVASVIADRSIGRAWDRRPSYPPFGLVQSLFSRLRVVAVDPQPFEAGSIAGFEDLGRAYLDTVVFHLERELAAVRRSDLAWLLVRLDELLALYRVDADRAGQARMRDGFSFMYGGLHFGTSLCVQLTEVMAGLLAGSGLAAGQKVEVLGRSLRAVHQLAAGNLDDIASLYRHLLGSSSSPWLSRDRFVIHTEGGKPQRIDVDPPPPGADDPGRYRTLGCPARSSPAGGPGAIATLWSWCAELAVATDLLAGG
jgi:hypothetical protein